MAERFLGDCSYSPPKDEPPSDDDDGDYTWMYRIFGIN